MSSPQLEWVARLVHDEDDRERFRSADGERSTADSV